MPPSEPPSRLGLRAGQKIEVRYLIRAAAIKSANDAATALGEAVAGSEEAFAARMNQYARAMGMTRTTFRNANGLTRDGHLSTARDMAILGRRLVYDFPQYYNIFSRNSTSAGIATVQNTNRRLLDAYPGADGIKTGYTRAAGFSLVSSAHRGNQRVIVAMMGGKSSGSRNAEVARLMDLGFSKMPRVARLAGAGAAPRPPRVAPVASAEARGSTSMVAAARRRAVVGRPRPRALADGSISVARNNQSITAAIAEVNADLAAAQTSRDLPGVAPERPAGAAPGRRRRPGAGRRRRLGLDLRGRAAARPRRARPCPRGRAGGELGRRHHRRQRLGRAARRLPRQGRRRAAAADHRAARRARAQRRAAPRRGRQGAGRDDLPRAVRRAEPGRRARRLRGAGAGAGRLPAAGAGHMKPRAATRAAAAGTVRRRCRPAGPRRPARKPAPRQAAPAPSESRLDPDQSLTDRVRPPPTPPAGRARAPGRAPPGGRRCSTWSSPAGRCRAGRAASARTRNSSRNTTRSEKPGTSRKPIRRASSSSAEATRRLLRASIVGHPVAQHHPVRRPPPGGAARLPRLPDHLGIDRRPLDRAAAGVEPRQHVEVDEAVVHRRDQRVRGRMRQPRVAAVGARAVDDDVVAVATARRAPPGSGSCSSASASARLSSGSPRARSAAASAGSGHAGACSPAGCRGSGTGSSAGGRGRARRPRCPARTSAVIRCMAVVDLPEPPFSLPMTISRAIRSTILHQMTRFCWRASQDLGDRR